MYFSSKDLQIELKRDYNNARYKKGDQVLDGTEWWVGRIMWCFGSGDWSMYLQVQHPSLPRWVSFIFIVTKLIFNTLFWLLAINQALGRCIRHRKVRSWMNVRASKKDYLHVFRIGVLSFCSSKGLLTHAMSHNCQNGCDLYVRLMEIIPTHLPGYGILQCSIWKMIDWKS